MKRKEINTSGELPKVQKLEPDIVSTGSSESTSSIGHPQFSSTPIGGKSAERIYKPDLIDSLEKLFLINMSKDVLVDAIMHANPEKNKVTIVGRPKLLGSSTKQMRHVTPFSFVEHSIRAALITPEGTLQDGHTPYVDSIVHVIQPLVKNKNGICILKNEVDNFSEFIEENEISEVLKFVTITQDGKEKTYYLIYDRVVVDEFNSSNEFTGKKFSEDDKAKSRSSFNKKFSKYVDYGIKYLKSKISSHNQNDPDTITLVCEGIARIILTMFNQDKYVAFPTEGNSLLREIRLYQNKGSAKNASSKNIQQQIRNKFFEVKSNTETVEIIKQAINDSNLADYGSRIRVVDNEGVTIRAVTDILCKLNDLVDNEITESINQQEYDDYNVKAESLNVKIDDRSSVVKYYQEINANNLSDCFHLHAARYLYMVFDLKPLENKVFAAMQNGDTNIVTVYPSATGARTAQYSIQDGHKYRGLEVNRATGYNNKIEFLSEMENEKLKELLIEKIIMHICYSLIPYTWLRTGCKTIDEQEEMNIEGEVKDERAGMNKIFGSFIQLVTQDYNNAEYIDNVEAPTKLDQAWIEKVQKKYQAVCQESFSDTSNVSSEAAQTNYSFRF